MEWTLRLEPRTSRQSPRRNRVCAVVSSCSCTHFVLLFGALLQFLFIPPVAVQDSEPSSASASSPPWRRLPSAFGGAVTEFSSVQSVIHETRTKCDRWGLNCSPNQFRVRRDASSNGQYRTIEDVTDSASTSRLNFFNHGRNSTTAFSSNRKNTHNSNPAKLVSVRDESVETTTAWDRSLIPNSFFSLAQSEMDLSPKGGGSTLSGAGHSEESSTMHELDTSASAERARRSPSSKRAALHYGPPVPMPPMRHGPRFRPLPPMPNRINYLPPQPFPPPMRPVHTPAPAPAPAPVPVPVPRPLPYTQPQNDYDYTGYGFGYGSAPEQQSHSHHRGVKRPAPSHMVRRMPHPSYAASRPMPRPLGALPRMRPKGRPGSMPRPPQYSYPKDAANIQDILTYFNENDNRPPAHYNPLIRAPKRPQVPLMPDRPTGGSAFSKELDDVQSSLMKDIREFAKRPAIMGSPTPESSYKPPSSYKQTYKNADDGSYEPKPKPVREMAKLNSKNRFEDSAERAKGDRYHLKDRDMSYEYRNRFKSYGVDESDERLPRPHRDYEYEHARPKSKSRPKYSSGSSLREAYHLQKKPLSDEFSNSEEWDLERDRSPSIYTPTSKPLVLKSPYGPYRSEAEVIKASRPYRKYWDSGEKDSYSSVPRVKAPSITYSPSKGKYKNISPEVIEDIVEIHTDPSYRVESTERLREEKERKAHLHRLYLEYLERKLEAEKLAMAMEAPSTTPKPMRMKIHIYPNENVKVAEASGGNGNFYYSQPTPAVSYSSNNPSIVSPPVRQFKSGTVNGNGNVYVGSHSHRVGVTGPQMGVDKNKNVVLHLHVHRRQGLGATGGMLAEASEIYTSTTKPLTYNEIFDDYQDLKHPTHKSSSSIDIADDKSVSMELPIQDEKIDDVLHTLLQLRKQRNAQS